MRKIFIIFALAISLLLTPLAVNQAFANESAIGPNDGVISEESVAVVEEIIYLSLQEAIEYALENSMEIKVARSALDVAEIVYEDDIRGIRTFERNPEIFYIKDPLFGMIEDAAINKRLAENGSMRRGVEFTYNRAKWDIETTVNKVKYNVEKAYFDLLLMEEELQIAEEHLALAQKQYDYGKLRYDVGMISQQQLLGLEFNLSQTLSAHESARMYYGLQKMSFRNTLGMPFDKEFNLSDTIEVKEYDEINLEASIESAIEENLAVRMAKENYELTQLMLEAVAVKYPDITYRYRTQAAEVVKAEQSYVQTKNGIEMMVRSAVVGLHTAEKQIATFQKAVFQASEGVRIAELSFELGQNTATEIAQANLNLMNAKKNLAQQIHAYNLALLDFEYSTGIGK